MRLNFKKLFPGIKRENKKKSSGGSSWDTITDFHRMTCIQRRPTFVQLVTEIDLLCQANFWSWAGYLLKMLDLFEVYLIRKDDFLHGFPTCSFIISVI